MNISPVNYNIRLQNINFKGHKKTKENKHIVAKTILAAGAITAAAITGMIIAKKFPNNPIIKNITSPLDKNANKTASKIAAAVSVSASAATVAAVVSTPQESKESNIIDDNSEKDSKNNEDDSQNGTDIINSVQQDTKIINDTSEKIIKNDADKPDTDIIYSLPKQLTGENKEKAQRLQDFIDEIVNSKVEPHISDLEDIEPANLTKPTEEEVIELEDGNKITKTTQYTKAHTIVTLVLNKPVNQVKKIEQIKHPSNKLSSVHIYDTANQIIKSSEYKYNYESGKLTSVTIHEKNLGRRSKIKYIYNDNFTRLEKIVLIGPDGKIQDVTKIPLSLNSIFKNSIYNIQNSVSEVGDKLSDSLHKFRKTAMF